MQKKVAKQVTRTEPAMSGHLDKKAYRVPELVELGSLKDLTKGDFGGNQDLNATGTVTFF